MSLERPALAYHDPEFLESDAARPLRIMAEYLQPLRAFREARVSETVVFFGSARLRADGPNGRYVAEAAELARLVTEWSLSLPENGNRLVVCSGEFHYFFMRKLWFAHLARAIVVFPGGFGTFDELFEMLTLAQTRKLDRNMLILLYGSTYWKEVINFEALVRHGVIGDEDLGLFSFVDEPRAALERLQSGIALDPAPAPRPAFAKSRHPHGDDGRSE